MTDRRNRFEELYAQSIDPWNFRTSGYERDKYRETVAALPASTYRCGIEAGCSIGELSRLIGERCQTFYGVDVSQTAIDEATERNADRPGLTFLRAELPEEWPSVSVDLIVLSEVLYFLSVVEINRLAELIGQNWEIGGDCVIVSFLGATSEALQGTESADVMIGALRSRMDILAIPTPVRNGYRLDVLQRRG